MLHLIMVSTLLLQIMRGIWFMEPNAAQGYMPVVASLINGKGDYAELMPNNQKEFKAWATTNLSSANLVTPNWRYGFTGITTKNSIAIIPLNGAVIKYDYCGSPGTKTITSYLKQIKDNPAFIGCIILTDSPGGAGDGTAQLANYISSFTKPIVAFIDGMMCSAAYWIGSAADEIIASYKTDIVGSIGTYVTLVDYTQYLEQLGIKELQIYATKSTEKNALYREAINGNPEPIVKQLIDPFNESFLSGVRKNRYGKGMNFNNAFTGRTYMASEAKQEGIIDAIGDIDYAIERVIKLSKAA